MSAIHTKANTDATQRQVDALQGRVVDDLRDQAAAIGHAEEEIEDLRANRRLRKWMTWLLLVQFTLANLATVGLFFLNGFGRTTLSDEALISLLGGTVIELAGAIVIVARYLFPNDRPDPKAGAAH